MCQTFEMSSLDVWYFDINNIGSKAYTMQSIILKTIVQCLDVYLCRLCVYACSSVTYTMLSNFVWQMDNTEGKGEKSDRLFNSYKLTITNSTRVQMVCTMYMNFTFMLHVSMHVYYTEK